MDCLHGVLMHNDETPDQDHKAEDQYLRFKSVLETDRPQAGPNDAESEFHGVLMHQDSETGIQHEEVDTDQVLPENNTPAGPRDQNDVIHEGMHGEEGIHKHERTDSDDNTRKLPMDSEQLMHGVLMHGDAEHGKHQETGVQEPSDAPAGPQNAADYMHGVMMHGDSEPGTEHAQDAGNTNSDGASTGPSGPDTDKLHGVLMHGDSEMGIDHSAEDSHSASSDESFSDFDDILSMDIDKEILEAFDIHELLNKDKEEYADWMKKNKIRKGERTMGSSSASVSDSIYNDIELMKEKYLSKSTDDTAPSRPADDIPFTAEDAMNALDARGDAHEHEDMKHDVELVGSTDPINMRHKIHNELQKSRSKSGSRLGL